MDDHTLPLPFKRGLSREQAADYLGIGITLFTELDIPFIKLGRRCIYDRVDLDVWLDENKKRGRAGKETLWPNKAVSTGDLNHGTGGFALPFQTAGAYAKALGLKTSKRPRRS